MTTKTNYFIRPQSPLVFRGGAPFGSLADGQGNQGDSGHRFPLPSTTAGALRAAWVDGAQHAVTAHDQTLLKLHVGGGLRAQRLAGQKAFTVFAPAPADARHLACSSAQWKLASSWPMPLPKGHACNLPHGLLPIRRPVDAGPVGTRPKDAANPPALWALGAIAQWLEQPFEEIGAADTCCHPPQSVRQHVVINPTTRTNEEQGFFETRGADFYSKQGDDGVLAWLHHEVPAYKVNTAAVGLAGQTSAAPTEMRSEPAPPPNTQHAHGRMGRFGADGRAASFEAVSDEAWRGTDGFVCPSDLKAALDALVPGAWFRLLLLTPACYLRNGWYPDGFSPVENQPGSALLGNLVPLVAYRPNAGTSRERRNSRQHSSKVPDLSGWRLHLRAAAVPPWQPLATGAHRADDGQALFTRRALQRLAPAGTVYWFQILAKGKQPLSSLWMQPTCREEFARDGFGLAVPGLAPNMDPQLLLPTIQTP